MITLAITKENIYLFDKFDEFRKFVERALINSDTGEENEVLECWVDSGNYTPSEYSPNSFTVKGIDFDDICLTATVVVLDEDDTPCRYCYDRYGIFNRDILPL